MVFTRTTVRMRYSSTIRLMLRGFTTAGRAVYLNKSTSTTYFTAGGNVLKNNIIVNAGGGYALEASSAGAAGTYFTANNNNYYASGTAPFGPGSSTLSAWQTASLRTRTLFGAIHCLLAQLICTFKAHLPIMRARFGRTTDIDGDTRSTTTPDMGADEYAPLTCFGVSGLGAANISDVSFDATWSSNNSTTIGSQVRYRLNGSTGAYTVMAGSTGTATITGLMASTSYDYSVREICSLGDTCSWSLDAQATPVSVLHLLNAPSRSI